MATQQSCGCNKTVAITTRVESTPEVNPAAGPYKPLIATKESSGPAHIEHHSTHHEHHGHHEEHHHASKTAKTSEKGDKAAVVALPEKTKAITAVPTVNVATPKTQIKERLVTPSLPAIDDLPITARDLYYAYEKLTFHHYLYHDKDEPNNDVAQILLALLETFFNYRPLPPEVARQFWCEGRNHYTGFAGCDDNVNCGNSTIFMLSPKTNTVSGSANVSATAQSVSVGTAGATVGAGLLSPNVQSTTVQTVAATSQPLWAGTVSSSGGFQSQGSSYSDEFLVKFFGLLNPIRKNCEKIIPSKTTCKCDENYTGINGALLKSCLVNSCSFPEKAIIYPLGYSGSPTAIRIPDRKARVMIHVTMPNCKCCHQLAEHKRKYVCKDVDAKSDSDTDSDTEADVEYNPENGPILGGEFNMGDDSKDHKKKECDPCKYLTGASPCSCEKTGKNITLDMFSRVLEDVECKLKDDCQCKPKVECLPCIQCPTNCKDKQPTGCKKGSCQDCHPCKDHQAHHKDYSFYKCPCSCAKCILVVEGKWVIHEVPRAWSKCGPIIKTIALALDGTTLQTPCGRKVPEGFDLFRKHPCLKFRFAVEETCFAFARNECHFEGQTPTNCVWAAKKQTEFANGVGTQMTAILTDAMATATDIQNVYNANIGTYTAAITPVTGTYAMDTTLYNANSNLAGGTAAYTALTTAYNALVALHTVPNYASLAAGYLTALTTLNTDVQRRVILIDDAMSEMRHVKCEAEACIKAKKIACKIHFLLEDLKGTPAGKDGILYNYTGLTSLSDPLSTLLGLISAFTVAQNAFNLLYPPV
jgi:hypothetical protein